MGLHGVGAQAQLLGNLGAGQALHQHSHDFLLPAGQAPSAEVIGNVLGKLAHAGYAKPGVNVLPVLGHRERADTQGSGHGFVGVAFDEFKKTANCLCVSNEAIGGIGGFHVMC